MNVQKDLFLKKCGGSFIRNDNKLYWIAPNNKRYHASPVFMKRAFRYPEQYKEISIEQKKEIINDGRGSEEIKKIEPKTQIEIAKEESKKKEKKNKNKTIITVEDEKIQNTPQEVMP